MSIGQVMIFASTLEKATSFYVDLLGLVIEYDMSNDGMLILKNEGAYLTIHEGFLPNPVPKDQCRIVPIFKVKDIRKAAEDLKSKGVELHGQITETPVHTYQTLKDFDGNWIEIAQFKNDR